MILRFQGTKRPFSTLVGVACGLLLLLCCGTVYAVPPSANLPLDSPDYAILDKLAGFGLIESSLQGSRPFSRQEAARQVAEARRNLQILSVPDVADSLVTRLENEFADELRSQNAYDTSGYFKPIRHWQVEYIYQDGDPSTISGPGVDAKQHALNYNNFGLDYDTGSNVQATFNSELRWGMLLLDWRPILSLQDGTTFRTLEGKAALQLGLIEISVGRQSLWWGQGHHGSLILTNNAKPLDMLRITNPTPVLLPWVFKYLGPFRFDVFWSKLEEDRVVPEPYFAGLRLNVKPLPWLEIGASRTVIFGGEGRPDVKLDDFLTILAGKNLAGADDTSDSVAALDGRVKIPVLWNLEFYAEFGGEDEANGFISNFAKLAGIYLPQIEKSGRFDLRIEYADLSHVDENSPMWYRHGIYRSGYTYENKILGHHVGGGGKDLYTEVNGYLPSDVTLTLSLDIETRGVDQAVEEKHLQPALALEWLVQKELGVGVRYAMDKVENADYIRDNDPTSHLVTAHVFGSW